MARFIIEKYTMVQSNRAEYKPVKINNALWFEANSTDEAIEKMKTIMEHTTYTIKIQTEKGYKPFYKAIKNKDDSIKILNDTRK
jgi:hypothetical protein